MHALPTPAAPSPMLARCLLLALLLHVWLVLLLGNAPGGTARQGEGVWGSINVTLRGPETRGAAEVPVPPGEVRDGPVGGGAVPRYGGAVRDATTPQPPDPGAAQLGEWAPLPAQPAAAEAPIAPLAPLAPTAPLPDTPAPPTPPGRVLEDSRLPRAPAVEPPLVAPRPAPSPPAAPALPTLRPPVAMAPPPPVERSLPTQLPREAPALRAVAPLESAVPAAARVLAAPQALPTLAPPLQPAPVEAPLRQLTAPPAAAAAPVAPLAPAAATPVESMPLAPAAPALAPALSPAPGPSSAAPGAPDAGSRIGADVATPPSAPASAPRLNLELARPRGGELSRGGSAGVLPLLPRPPELSDKLARDIEKSAKGDCRTAHAGSGLLAVVPLAVDAVRNKDGGCKW